jgi:hypothetical protein
MENKKLEKEYAELLEKAEPLLEKYDNGTITKEEQKELDKLNKRADEIQS